MWIFDVTWNLLENLFQGIFLVFSFCNDKLNRWSRWKPWKLFWDWYNANENVDFWSMYPKYPHFCLQAIITTIVVLVFIYFTCRRCTCRWKKYSEDGDGKRTEEGGERQLSFKVFIVILVKILSQLKLKLGTYLLTFKKQVI